MSGFAVKQPGLLSLLQDLGRYGRHNLGLTTGGPLDGLAFNWANRLLDNDSNATGIEISFGGLSLLADCDCSIAITGAETVCKRNGEIMPMWQSIDINQGDLIEFGFSSAGVRSYLAVAGGFQVKPSFGSSATVVREKIGGLHGDKLQSDDYLECRPVTVHQHQLLSTEDRPQYGDSAVLRLVPGYQQSAFDHVQQYRFFNSDYSVTERSDRMGFRLEGESIHSDIVGMLSEGICHGAVQIPADGQPIVLMNDRQTIGGYPKIGSVIPADTARLAQLSPGAKIRFEAIGIEQANAIHWLELSRYQRTQLKSN